MARTNFYVLLAGLSFVSVSIAVSTAWSQTMSEAPAKHEPFVGAVLFDQFEYRLRDKGQESVAWDGQAWYGGDYDKVFFKTAGEHDLSGYFERAETQLLYSRLVTHFWDVQAGIRYDFEPAPSRTYGVVGLQGLAPGFFEVDLQGFISEKGDLSARFEAEYDLLITQRLVLQPKAEFSLAAQSVPELQIGEGLTDLELGLRLRYEFSREFAPYIGVHWERKVGETARVARRDGEHPDTLSFVAGVRFWF